MAAEMADHHGTAFLILGSIDPHFCQICPISSFFLPIVFDALSETENTLGEAR